MSKALLPFYALYVGDGSTTVFTLDVSKDPYYRPNGISFTSFSARQGTVASENISPEFDHKLPPTAVVSVTAQAGNGNDYGPVSTSITQSQLTFTLSSAPPPGPANGGGLFNIRGFIEY